MRKSLYTSLLQRISIIKIAILNARVVPKNEFDNANIAKVAQKCKSDCFHTTTCTDLNSHTNFSSEGVRCGTSQKKPLWDSTKTYSPKGFTFRDVPQVAAYHEKKICWQSGAFTTLALRNNEGLYLWYCPLLERWVAAVNAPLSQQIT